MVTIVDYGMGNLRSVQKAFERVGVEAEVQRDPKAVTRASKLVLPGVGAFGMAMAHIDELQLREPLLEAVHAGTPLLGICLGLQLLFESSEELGRFEGLGLLTGAVKRFPENGLRVPHIGWNEVHRVFDHPILDGVPDREFFYFDHSYYVVPSDDGVTAGLTDYGIDFPAVVAREKVWGIQFHPEKSQTFGLQILRNFGALRC
ncbi:MAG: imidazole glycerol phosphate synthase subunit HisH [Candidatus Latescibacteria bacterium]|nr:imidazole glycerol phosphate synthase subunit HisH [Candidatus Latescibacterota bacterium]